MYGTWQLHAPIRLRAMLVDMALRYLHARMAALRVLGPSSAWFLAAVTRMSRASSSGDLVSSVLVVLGAEASTSQTGASLVLGRLAGMTKVG